MDARIPPQNIQAEAALLGAIIVDNEALVKVGDALLPVDFYDERHRRIYEAVLALNDKHQAIDVLTLSDCLKSQKLLDLAGGPAYLTELTNSVDTVAHARQYAEMIAQKAMRRRLIKSSQDMMGLGYDETKSLQELIEESETSLFKVSQRYIRQDVAPIESVLVDSLARLEELHKGKGSLRGTATGFKDLDNLLSGLQPSDLIILAARPSIGKSALALNLAYNAAKTKQAVLFFSLEMSKQQLVDRLLSLESGVNSWGLRTGNLADTDYEKITAAMGPLSELPIYLDDTPAITVSDLRTKARREHHKHPLGLIIVDYLQLMGGGARFSSSDSRVQEISEISRGLKAVARELNVPLLALSQLSRQVEQRKPQIPQLADLRDSGALEQDADVVMFLYREDYYNPETDRKNVAEVLVKKHRNGPTGNIELYFDRDRQQFRSLDKRAEAAYDWTKAYE